MRRALVPLLFACACSASPPPPPPPPPAPPPPAPQAVPRGPWLEVDAAGKTTLLTRRDPDGRTLYEVRLGAVRAVLGAPDGGAYAVVEERNARAVLRLDALGKEAWKAPIPGGGWAWQLAATEERVFAFDDKALRVLDAADGSRVREVVLKPAPSDVDERNGIVVAADAKHVTRLTPDGDPAWSIQVGLFPSLDPSSERVADRKVAVGFDGTVLTGGFDGSLVGLDPEGKPLYQLGLRGAVARIEASPDGDFLVTTSAGIVAVVGPGGIVRRETELRPERPPEGWSPPLKRVSKGKPAAASVPRWKPTAAYRAHPEGLAGKAFHGVGSVVALAPNDVWALVRGDRKPGEADEPDYHLVHYDGRTWSDLGAPSLSFAKEVFADGQPATTGVFIASSLARSPTGALLVIGARVGDGNRRLCVLERTASGFRERRELFATLAKIPIPYNAERNTTYAASASGREVLCNGKPPTCVELGPGISPRILPTDQGRTGPERSGEVPGNRGYHLSPVLFAGDTLWRMNGWAATAADLWGLSGSKITHWNGTAFETRDTPLDFLQSAWGSGPDDLWITGASGVARFDGARWWRILEIAGTPRFPSYADLSVTGSGRGDVWISGGAGLWHVTPDAHAQPDLEGTPAPPPPATAPSLALPVGPVDPSYRLERVVLPVDGGPPVRAALSIAEGPGGVLWLHDGVRVVEHDGTHTRVLYQSPKPEPFVCWSAPEPDCEVCAACTDRTPKVLGCQRCVAPTAAGEGAMLAGDGLLRITGGHAPAQPAGFSALLAVAAAPSGAIWTISARDDDSEPHAVIQGPQGRRLVSGLPPAAYADVAILADDDVWMAGGLTTHEEEERTWPEGEGTLVRFDGRTFTRHRAPDGALLSVAAAGPGEAWAVGLGGGVLHAKAGAVEAFHLEREGGSRLPVILRGVSAAGPNEVWMVGDQSTLLRWDGRALRRVDASGAGRAAALSAVIAPGARPGWVAGPTGIWKVVRAR